MLSNFFKKIGTSFTTIIKFIFSNKFLFGTGLTFTTKLFRIFGLISFISTFFIAGKTALSLGGTPIQLILAFISEIAKSIIGVDQYIYNLSLSYSQIIQPTIYQSLELTFNVITKSFYYMWWFRIYKKMIVTFGLFKVDQSVVTAKLDWLAFKMLYVTLIIANITYMLSTKQITFNFQQLYDPMSLFNNIYIFFNTLFSNWWHFFVAFKGIGHYFIFSLGKSISIFMGTEIAQNILENITNESEL